MEGERNGSPTGKDPIPGKPLKPIAEEALANPAKTDLTAHGHHRTALLLAGALRDVDKWGPDTLEFKLRNLTKYNESTKVAWALPATKHTKPKKGAKFPARTGVDASSRGCPAKGLSMAMSLAFFHALKASGAAQWKHADSDVVKELIVSKDPKVVAKNGDMNYVDCTPFVEDFLLQRIDPKVTAAIEALSKKAKINPGGFGCSVDSDCEPLRKTTANKKGAAESAKDEAEQKCFSQHGKGKCLAEAGTLGSNTMCFRDDECASAPGSTEGKCEQTGGTLTKAFRWSKSLFSSNDEVAGICAGRVSTTAVSAPMPEHQCKKVKNPNTCGACTSAKNDNGDKDCAWCFAYKWAGGKGRCVSDAEHCTTGSVFYSSKTLPTLFDATKKTSGLFHNSGFSGTTRYAHMNPFEKILLGCSL